MGTRVAGRDDRQVRATFEVENLKRRDSGRPGLAHTVLKKQVGKVWPGFVRSSGGFRAIGVTKWRHICQYHWHLWVKIYLSLSCLVKGFLYRIKVFFALYKNVIFSTWNLFHFSTYSETGRDHLSRHLAAPYGALFSIRTKWNHTSDTLLICSRLLELSLIHLCPCL
jgi:hypothetical protein